MTLRMEVYFVGKPKDALLKKNVIKLLLDKLSYKEKVEISYKSKLISNEINKFLLQLNKLRNYCAHTWVPGDEEVNLLYDGKDLLEVSHFKIFFNKSKEILYGAYPGFAEIDPEERIVG